MLEYITNFGASIISLSFWLSLFLDSNVSSFVQDTYEGLSEYADLDFSLAICENDGKELRS